MPAAPPRPSVSSVIAALDSTTSTTLPDELRLPLSADDAVLEAERCLACGGPYAQAPCTVACPADVDVPRFVGEIAAGDTEAAARTIFEENLLGGTCARVCPVEILCEGSCVLNAEGRRPIAIGPLQRFATDEAFAGNPILRKRALPATGKRVAVLGAGPAGLAAAGELALLGHHVVVYDERDEPGGLARFAIAPFRQQCEPIPAEARAIAQLGVQLRLGAHVGSAQELTAIAAEADALLLAVGMGEDVQVSYPGDDLPGVHESLPFVEALKRGEPFEVGDHVVVIGGGNTAIDCSREARRLGAHVVTLAYRRTEDEMPAFAHEVAEARDEDVHFRWLANPTRVLGTTHVTGVECVEMRLGGLDASGRHRPEPVPGSEFVLEADTVIKAIGQRPRSELLDRLPGLSHESGRIVADPQTGATGAPGVFAAGDAVAGGSIVVQAVRTAKLAARGIDAFLREKR
jgi:dihydropyrimidine dehydrogenase (NAD+) subunit PreT